MLYLFVTKLQNSIIVQVFDLIIVYALIVVIRESTQMHTHMYMYMCTLVHVHACMYVLC